MAVNTNQNPELWPGTVAFTQKKKEQWLRRELGLGLGAVDLSLDLGWGLQEGVVKPWAVRAAAGCGETAVSAVLSGPAPALAGCAEEGGQTAGGGGEASRNGTCRS